MRARSWWSDWVTVEALWMSWSRWRLRIAKSAAVIDRLGVLDLDERKQVEMKWDRWITSPNISSLSSIRSSISLSQRYRLVWVKFHDGSDDLRKWLMLRLCWLERWRLLFDVRLEEWRWGEMVWVWWSMVVWELKAPCENWGLKFNSTSHSAAQNVKLETPNQLRWCKLNKAPLTRPRPRPRREAQLIVN